MTVLPIDYTKRPYRAKYLDEETPEFNGWFIFGTRDNGTVDISSPNSDIAINVPKEVAKEIIEARDGFIRVLLKHFSN